jgi:hypothetical protein
MKTLLKLAFWSLPIVAAVTSGLNLPLDEWVKLRGDLLVFLGIYAAALIQVAVTAANLNLPDDLDVSEAKQLAAHLLRQQRYWVGLFCSVVFATLVLVMATYMHTDFEPDSASILQGGILHIGKRVALPLAPIGSGALGLMLAFLLMQTFNFMAGLLSLQNLRSHYLVESAKKRAAKDAAAIEAGTSSGPFKAPEGYGTVRRAS